MFRNRKNSQKPSDGLYKDFKDSFPHMNNESSTSTHDGQVSLSDVVDDSALDASTFDNHQDSCKDGEPVLSNQVDDWNFNPSGLTPSLLDPTSTNFNSFANQMPDYYGNNSGGTNLLFHSMHAGDLHTPSFHHGINTPTSMPASEAALHQAQAVMAMPAFAHSHHMQNPIATQSQQFQNMNPYNMHQQPYAPQPFSNRFPPFQQNDLQSSTMSDVQMTMSFQNPSQDQFRRDSFRPATASTRVPHPLTEKFRYNATLNAATAMVKHEDEIPITYLNKGQAYTLNVVDTDPQHSPDSQPRYRTFVRVSFEDPEQRKRPAACWQLWKEGRGTNEAHLRGGRLQAVEFVSSSDTSGKDQRRAKMEIESASYDGFCVLWTPAADGPIECPIPVRFNFLSTDFSHSKGVKGIPVRLCAKTEVIQNSMTLTAGPVSFPEVCFCKVKLFRDHGAERKLSNDVAHVKKSIEKIEQQIAQMEAGLGDSGKRKRGSMGLDSQRPGKVQKHRRTWSLSSSTSPEKFSAEDELHMKLAVLKEMFSSTHPSSILFLRGAPEDDPDLHPVRLSGEPDDLTKVESNDGTSWDNQSAQSSTRVSPSPSTPSYIANPRQDSGLGLTKSQSMPNTRDWKQLQRASMPQQQPTPQSTVNPQHLASPPEHPIKVQINSPTNTSGWIESLGVDAAYRPPSGQSFKPVACFHLQPRVAGLKPEGDFYRAIYLAQRTLQDFVGAVCLKLGLDSTKVARTIRVNKQGLQVLLDDADIAHMPEGQDMTADFSLLGEGEFDQQWHADGLEMQVDGEMIMHDSVAGGGYELRLYY